jgi:hypothetical protein
MIPISFCPPILAWHYDPNKETLDVQLPDQVYRVYSGVNASIFERLIDTTKTGRFSLIERLPHRPLFGDDSAAADTGGIGDRLVEMQLTRDYGEPGSATRTRYDELLRHLDTLPLVNLENRLAGVRAALASVNLSSEPEEVAGLMLEEMALLRIISTGEPERAALQAEIDNLRAEHQRGAQDRFRRQTRANADTLAAYARLAELNNLISDPPTLDHVDKGKHYPHMSITAAQKTRLTAWREERSQLRAQFGLPDDVDESDDRPSWMRPAERVDSPAIAAEGEG